MHTSLTHPGRRLLLLCTHPSHTQGGDCSPLYTSHTHPGRRLFTVVNCSPHTQGGACSPLLISLLHPGRRLSPLYNSLYTQGGDCHRCTHPSPREETVTVVYTLPHPGRRLSLLCTYYIPTMGERLALCAEYSTHHGREASTLRREVSLLR